VGRAGTMRLARTSCKRILERAAVADEARLMSPVGSPVEGLDRERGDEQAGGQGDGMPRRLSATRRANAPPLTNTSCQLAEARVAAATNAAAWPGVSAVVAAWRPSTRAAQYTMVSGLTRVAPASAA
jgi:hypothetical protein